MEQIANDLRNAGVEKVYTDHVLAGYTTWKIGGKADLFVVPNKEEELVQTVQILNRFGIPWMLLGRGSNVLISDKGYRGVMIKLGPAFENVHFDGEEVHVGGAYSFIRLSVMAGRKGLTGMEWAGGIPGNVGGAIFMNAGAHGSDVSRILKYADVVLETGEQVRWSNDELQFSYRHSRLQVEKGIVTGAVFQLQYGDRKEIAAAMASYKERRLRTQPLSSACAGSVFRNPPGDHAARLIETAGLKGVGVGGAIVSPKHANFIENTGQATADDVLALIDKIREAVLKTHGIELKTEVLWVGER